MGQSYAEYLIEIGEKRGEERAERRAILQNTREWIILAIENRFGEVPLVMQDLIAANDDPDLLRTWLRHAATVPTLEELNSTDR